MSAFASCLYVGHVRHRRRGVAANTFRYRAYHVLLDVDELPRLDRELLGFGYNRPGVVGFRDRDHLGPGDAPVREKLDRWLRANGSALPDGPVRVLTNLRVLGHVFDPVSWWWCFQADGSVAFVVAEVHNTFGETHLYLFDQLATHRDGTMRASVEKRFHVSPFLPVAGLRYDVTLLPPGERALAHLDVMAGDDKRFDATQSGRYEPLTATRLAWRLLTHPFMTLRTILLIHGQAVRLWLERAPFHRKPAPPDDPVLRPAERAEVNA